MKIGPVGAELLRTDRRADVIKPVVAFRRFAKAPKNGRRVNLDTRLPFNVNMNA